MIRVVLDTNVVVSAHLNAEGYERYALDLALAGKIELAVSDPILAEYRGVLLRPRFGIGPRRVANVLRLIRTSAKIARPRRHLSISIDPADNRFLECCETSRADYLITGNKRHFPSTWRGTKIVNAREFAEWIALALQR